MVNLTGYSAPLAPLRVRGTRSSAVSCEDMFVVLHNAVKHQLYHFFTILSAVKGRSLKTTRREDNQLSDWWMAVAGFVETAFLIEDTVLMPLIYPVRFKLEVNNFLTSMSAARVDLQKKLKTLNNAVDELFVAPMKLCYNDICMALDKWLPTLLAYYSRQETMFPQLVVGYNTSTEAAVCKSVLDHISKSPRPELYLGMLLVWMSSDHWRRMFLPSPVARIRFSSRVAPKHYAPHESTVDLLSKSVQDEPHSISAMRLSFRNSRHLAKRMIR